MLSNQPTSLGAKDANDSLFIDSGMDMDALADQPGCGAGTAKR